MNTRFTRIIRRTGIGATALFAAATAFAAPALAAETTADLELKVEGTTLAAGVASKEATFTVTNLGPQTANEVNFTIDLTALDDAKVTFSREGGCTPTGKIYDCVYNDPIAVGESWDNIFKLTRVGASTGAAGTIKITLDSDQDQNTANNSKTVAVQLSADGGVDLTADAWDIVALTAGGAPNWGTGVEPGDESLFFANVYNQGSAPSHAIKMSIKLPAGVTFVGTEVDCDYVTGDSEAECLYDGAGGVIAAGEYNEYFFAVKVSDSVTGPIVLAGGEFVVTDDVEIIESPEFRAGGSSSNFRAGLKITGDVDDTDNADEFTAYVAKKGGTGGGLPVTGVQIGAIAGVGAIAVLGGGMLVLMARRRRVTV